MGEDSRIEHMRIVGLRSVMASSVKENLKACIIAFGFPPYRDHDVARGTAGAEQNRWPFPQRGSSPAHPLILNLANGPDESGQLACHGDGGGTRFLVVAIDHPSELAIQSLIGAFGDRNHL